MQWLTDNMPFLNALGQLGQFFAALFAAYAAWQARRATQVAETQTSLTREEAVRNQQSFQFSWQPLLQVKFDIRDQIGREQELVLPSRLKHERYNTLCQEAKDVVYDFNNWRSHFAENPTTTTTTNPNGNYLVARIVNLQSNPAGQAVNVAISVIFHYADPIKPDTYEEKSRKLYFALESISPEQEIEIWLSHIELVPKLRVAALEINCQTWSGVRVRRGAGGIVDLRGPHPVYTVSLVDEECVSQSGKTISLRDGISRP